MHAQGMEQWSNTVLVYIGDMQGGDAERWCLELSFGTWHAAQHI